MSSRQGKPRPTIWISAAGTGTSFGLIASIRERWADRYRIIAADINPPHLVAASALADQYIRVPPVADPDFAALLTRQLGEQAVDLYVPVLDEEIVLAAELRLASRLPERTVCHAVDLTTAKRCFDKLEASTWLVEHGFPAPQTMPLSQARWLGKLLFAKPRYGRGSIGARLVTTEKDFQALHSEAEELIVQSVCAGPEITVDAFLSNNGRCFGAVCRERLEVKAGVCTKARVFADESLSSLIHRLALSLGLKGAFCVQVMRAADDSGWLLTDINPRPGAGTRLSVAAGFDVHSALVMDAFGEDPSPMLPALPMEKFVVRQYSEFVLQ